MVGLSDHVLKYDLGGLNLKIDFTRSSNQNASGSSLPPGSRADQGADADPSPDADAAPDSESNNTLEAPLRWFPDLGAECLQFDEAFREEYLLGHAQFDQVLKSKLAYFFEGALTRRGHGAEAHSVSDHSEVRVAAGGARGRAHFPQRNGLRPAGRQSGFGGLTSSGPSADRRRRKRR